ncbi:MAG TPA: hypothetical protein VN872_02040 [Candidatus Acidoferrum sp.]|nr:hypothetical protein [Candidatus Acidoferrum sp.]
MYRFLAILLVAVSLGSPLAAQRPDSTTSTGFKVKYVADDTVYLDAGKNSGLTVGMTLTIRRAAVLSAHSGDGQVKAKIVVAKITVASISNTSAMCRVRAKNSEIRPGDMAMVQERERAENNTQSFVPTTSPLTQRVAVNVPTPELNNPWVESKQKSQVVVAVQSVPKSLPEQMAENAKNRLPAEPSGNNASISAREKVEGPREREAKEKVTVASAAQSSQKPVDVAQSQPQQNATVQSPAVPAAAQVVGNSTLQTQARPEALIASKATAAPGAATSAVVAQNTSPKPPPSTAPSGGPAHPSTASSAVISAVAKPAPEPPRQDVAAAPAATKTDVTVKPITPATTPSEKVMAQAIPDKTPVAVIRNASAEPVVPRPQVVAAGATAVSANKTTFNVKYVAEDAVYIDGGKDAGLVRGMALTVKKADAMIAELTVASVSNTSAVCEIRTKNADLQRGDIALLSQTDQDKLVQEQTLGPHRKYPIVVAFSEGDPLDEEARESVPKPPLPEINRARGRIGLDSTFIRSAGSSAANSYQVGGVVRVDMSRIAGTYWNLNGYWRGRLNALSSSNQPQSVFDLVNRTYTIGFTYANPGSRWVAGFGRQYLPWAPSLDTTDGGYLGRKVGRHTTLGVFAGTAPDPASFNYNPNLRTAGSFIALEAGSFDGLRFTSTEGIAVSGEGWRENRQFLFSENGLFFKRFFSIYHSAQADKLRLPTGGTTEGLARSFATLRVQPFSRFSIDVNHNYFRDVPTFDPSLVGTGLLDKFLFQGVSVGGRFELPGHISLYNNLGQSSKSGDAHNSFNQLYGVTAARLWKTGLRGDVRYSKFNSSFGQGNYRAASLSRSFSERMRVEVTAGQQKFLSSVSAPTNYRLLGSTVDLNFGGHYFMESGFNLQRSPQQNFDQLLMTMGYRFDTKRTR